MIPLGKGKYGFVRDVFDVGELRVDRGGSDSTRRAKRKGRTAKSNMPGFLASLKSLPSATLAYA